MKNALKLIFSALFFLFLLGCNKDESDEEQYAELKVSAVEFTEKLRNKVLDPPSGSYRPDNPDFDIAKPETWTGNMAQYVNHNYLYSLRCSVKNSGGRDASNVELDLHYVYDNGEEFVKTEYIGTLRKNEELSQAFITGCTNKQLKECRVIAYWSY